MAAQPLRVRQDLLGWHDVDALPANLQLLVAAFDLKLVKSLRSAIRTADLSSGKGMPAAAIGPAPSTSASQQPAAVYEPRRHIHPEPKIEPRRHIVPSSIYAIDHGWRACDPPTIVFVPVCPEGVRPTKLTLDPPWKNVPWNNPPEPPPITKVIVRINDKHRRGQMIDLFI